MVRDYSKGVIYKLCCKDVNIKEIYVGSSINMRERKKGHSKYSNNSNTKLYRYIRENGGWNNWNMIWIKNYPCNSKRELEAEEDKIMRELNATLNTNNAICNIEEKKEKTKIKNKKYREKNKEKIKEKEKEYRETNKEKIKEKQKIKIMCECGCMINKSNISTHKKTKKHLKLLSS